MSLPLLQVTGVRAFDTESAGSSYATGFVVDKARGASDEESSSEAPMRIPTYSPHLRQLVSRAHVPLPRFSQHYPRCSAH